jgi:uncharacterized protein (DUF58 family)
VSAAPSPLAAPSGVAAGEPSRLAPRAVSADAVVAGALPFGFGRRFLVLFACGLAWLAPAWWDARFAWLVPLWDALLLLAWALDLRRLPGTGELRLTRRWLGPLALGRETAVTLELEHRAATALRADLIDDLPVGVTAVPPRLELRAPAAPPAGVTRALGRTPLRPRTRGDQRVGRVSARLESALGLAQRRLAFDLAQTVRVYPPLPADEGLSLAALRSRQLELERRRQRFAGVRREFEALRDWRDGDEPRDVCWPASARRNRLVSKQWRAERSQTLWIVIDAGRLMGARAGDRSRLDVAVDAALRLARVATAAGDRVGLLVYGRAVRQRVLPGRGRVHQRALLEALAVATREPFEADHLRAAEALLGRQKQRALVVWITDVAETAGVPDVIESAVHVARRHLVLFLAMAHREIAAVAAATPADVDAMYRRAAAQELATRREALLRGLRLHGAMVVEAEPGAVATRAINGYLQAKERSRL